MSPLPPSRRLAARAAVATTVLLALAATGIAASAVTDAVASTPERKDAAARIPAARIPAARIPADRIPAAQPHALATAEVGAVRAAALQVAPAATSSTTITKCTTTPRPAYTPGATVSREGFEYFDVPPLWSGAGGTALSISPQSAFAGGIGLLAAPVGAPNGGTLSWRSNAFFTPGTYRISLYVRLHPATTGSPTPPPGGSAMVGFQVSDTDSGNQLGTAYATLTSQWTAVNVPVTPRLGPLTGACAPSGDYARPVTVKVVAMAPGCGTMPSLALDIDEVSETYLGVAQTTAPTVAKVRPACVPPTTTASIPPTTTTRTPTSKPPAKSICKVKVTAPLVWNGGVQAAVTLTNLSGLTLRGWTLKATLPPGESLGYGWPVSASQSGSGLTVVPVSGWGEALAPRDSLKFGLVLGGGSALPTAWTLDGTACKVG